MVNTDTWIPTWILPFANLKSVGWLRGVMHVMPPIKRTVSFHWHADCSFFSPAFPTYPCKQPWTDHGSLQGLECFPPGSLCLETSSFPPGQFCLLPTKFFDLPHVLAVFPSLVLVLKPTLVIYLSYFTIQNNPEDLASEAGSHWVWWGWCRHGLVHGNLSLLFDKIMSH